MPTSTDAALVSGHLAGDQAALAGIYDRYADTLYDTAAAMLRSRDDAADVLQDTILIAAERLGQLRDPDRLKPWLFAILRNEVYRRSRNLKRTVVTDFSGGEDGIDVADNRHPGTDDAVADAMAGDDFAAMLRCAAAGLDERDQLVLELSVRQGLDGQDLADALGVSANQSYTLVHRMRERVERSLGAYAIARAGRKDCDDLDAILARWDGEFTVLIRKRVGRHIDKCSTCSTNRTKVAPLALFAGAPALAAPPQLRSQILTEAGRTIPKHDYGFATTGGFPEMLHAAHRIAAWIPATAAATLILIAGTVAFMMLGGTDESTVQSTARSTPTEAPTTVIESNAAPTTTTTAVYVTAAAPATTGTSTSTTSTTAASSTTTMAMPPTAPRTTAASSPPPLPPPQPTITTAPQRPGELSLSASIIDLDATAPSGSVTVTNVGGTGVALAISGDPMPFSVAPTSGVLEPGQSVSLTVAIDRAKLREGDHMVNVQVSGDGTTRMITLRARTERPPDLGLAGGPNGCFLILGGGFRMFVDASASISDETSPISATLAISGPNGRSGSAAMSPDADSYSGLVALDFKPNEPPGSTWSWSISATDGRGNTSSTDGSIRIGQC